MAWPFLTAASLWEKGRAGSGDAAPAENGLEESRRTVRATGLIMRSDTSDDIGRRSGY